MSRNVKGTSRSVKGSSRKINYQSNIRRGIAAEERVLKTIPSKFNPKRVTPNKRIFDKGAPDITFIRKGKVIPVEVKSIREYTRDGHGRAQFLRSELRYLAQNNGIIIFEVRHSSKDGWEKKRKYQKSYFKAPASKVWNILKQESGSELKLEFSQITSFKRVSSDNPLEL